MHRQLQANKCLVTCHASRSQAEQPPCSLSRLFLIHVLGMGMQWMSSGYQCALYCSQSTGHALGSLAAAAHSAKAAAASAFRCRRKAAAAGRRAAQRQRSGPL